MRAPRLCGFGTSSLVTLAACALPAIVACSACSGSDGSVATAPAATEPTGGEAGSPPSAPAPASPSSSSSPSPSPTPAGPPAALTCLSKLYVGTPAKVSTGGWALQLADASELAWDDAQKKTYDEALAQPDLEDTLEMPYVLGGIKAITKVNDDPGRIRNDALFKATFGATSAAVQQKLVTVDFVGQPVKFHARAAAALGKVSVRLEQLVAKTPALAAYVTGELGGTFEWRPIANTNRLSAHSYGIAIDIVVAKSNYWEWESPPAWKNQIPQAIVDAFEAEGFAWGGRWYHYDTMHFEYRPELFDSACKP